MARQGGHPCGPGQFVYLLRRQVRTIVAPICHGSLFQAGGCCGKRRGSRDVLATASHCPHWPAAANRGQVNKLAWPSMVLALAGRMPEVADPWFKLKDFFFFLNVNSCFVQLRFVQLLLPFTGHVH